MFLSGVQSEYPPGFPLKACGNDGLWEGANSRSKLLKVVLGVHWDKFNFLLPRSLLGISFFQALCQLL